MKKTKRLPQNEDAYGHEVWDYYARKQGYEIIERDDGFIDSSSGPSTYFSSFKVWPDIERKALRYARGRVLDVGCGAGRHSLYLQNSRNLDVLGIDSSPLAIKVSKLRGLRRAKLIPFNEINFRPSSFDTVIMLGNNFGLFANKKTAKRLLTKLYLMTSDEGVLICESLDPHKTDSQDHLNYQRENRERGRLSGQVRIRARYRRYIGKWFDYLLVSPREMEALLGGTGWKVVRFIESKKSSPLYIGMLRKGTPNSKKKSDSQN